MFQPKQTLQLKLTRLSQGSKTYQQDFSGSDVHKTYYDLAQFCGYLCSQSPSGSPDAVEISVNNSERKLSY